MECTHYTIYLVQVKLCFILGLHVVHYAFDKHLCKMFSIRKVAVIARELDCKYNRSLTYPSLEIILSWSTMLLNKSINVITVPNLWTCLSLTVYLHSSWNCESIKYWFTLHNLSHVRFRLVSEGPLLPLLKIALQLTLDWFASCQGVCGGCFRLY